MEYPEKAPLIAKCRGKSCLQATTQCVDCQKFFKTNQDWHWIYKGNSMLCYRCAEREEYQLARLGDG